MLDAAQVAVEKQWLRDEQLRLKTWVVSHGKALTLPARIVGYRDEWLVFVEDPRVPPTNNLAEQALRPLVVLRKITFGHRERKGGERMTTLMSVAETARRHGHRASQIFLAPHDSPSQQGAASALRQGGQGVTLRERCGGSSQIILRRRITRMIARSECSRSTIARRRRLRVGSPLRASQDRRDGGRTI